MITEELQQKIDRRKSIDAEKVPVRVDESTWLLVPLKHKNKRYINKWRKLANRDKYRLAEKFDELYGGIEMDD